MKKKPITHKTCPTWGMTQCRLGLFGTRSVKTSYRWRDVTCQKCLKDGKRN